MKTFRFSLVFAGVLVCALSAHAASTISLKGDKMVGEVNGKAFELSASDMRWGDVDNSKLQYIGIGGDVAKNVGLKPALLFFDANGKLLKTYPFEDADECVGASLSPDGTIIAVGTGMSGVTYWKFYTGSDLKPLFEQALALYAPEEQKEISWIGDVTAIVHTVEQQDDKRQCEHALCISTSVELLDVKSGKTKPIFKGTELCDYVFDTMKDGVVTASAICLPKAVDWKNADAQKTIKKVTAKLP